MKKTKVISLLICLIFAFSVMLTACGTGESAATPTPTPEVTATPATTPTPSAEPVSTEVGKPDRIDLTKTFYFGDSLDNTATKKNYMDWMSEEYGIDFKIHYPARNSYIEVINLAVAAQDLDGMVQLFNSQGVREWKADGLIYPLDKFLANNEVFNTTYLESWKETYTYDGELWALATGDDNLPSTLFARSIRGDWLAALGLQKPSTVWELYDASYKFTYNDPDGNGVDDTYGMTSRTTWLMQDLFQAFDARLNYEGDSLPIWNPNTNLWEDSMLKPEMVECLELLQKMATENVMDKEAFVHSSSVARGKVQSGYYGGLFYWDTWIQSFETSVKSNFPDAWMDGIYALKGNISVNINSYGIGEGVPPMVMTITTPQPEETINWYMNIFYGSAEGVFRGRYGIQGDFIGEGMFTLSGNKVYLNYFMKDGKVTGWGAPGISAGNPEYAIGTVYEVIYNSPDLAWNEATTLRTNTGLKQRKAWFDEAVSWGGLYILPQSLKALTSDKYLTISADLLSSSQEAISKSMISEISIEDALAKYRETAKALGAQQVLDEANAEIGQIGTQKY